MTASARTKLLAVLAAVAASAGGCDRPDPMAEAALSADKVMFEAPPASGDPAPQTVFVANLGKGSLARPTISVAYDDGATGWLQATASGSGAPYPVTLQARVGDLAPGTYEATVTAVTPGAGGSPRQLAVTLRVPDPRFALSTSVVVLEARGGGDPPPGAIQVTNGGRGALPVPQLTTAYVGLTGWLSAEVGGTPGDYIVTLNARAAGLPSGTYAATVAIDAEGASGGARTLSVTLVVPQPELGVSAAEVAIAGPQDGSDPEPVALTVTNAGGGFLAAPTATVAFPHGGTPPWLTAEVSGSAPPFAVTLRARQSRETVALEQGVYLATVTLASPSAANPVVVPVTLTVPRPILHLSQDPHISLGIVPGCPLTLPFPAIRITNGGPGTLPPVTASVEEAAREWLEARLTGGGNLYLLTLRLVAPPPVLADSRALVSLAYDGIVATLFVQAGLVAPPWGSEPVSAWLAETSVEIHAQRGAGDPGPRRIDVQTSHGCVSPPTLQVSYPSGQDEGWLEASAIAEGSRTAVVVQASTTALDPEASPWSGKVTTDLPYIPDPNEPPPPLELPPVSPTEASVYLTIGDFGPAAPMREPRVRHTLTALPGFGALAVGGGRGGTIGQASVERYERSGWLAAAPMSTSRFGHGAISVPAVGILVVGGQHGRVGAPDEVLASTEVYDPSRYEWRAGPGMRVARSWPSLARVADGRVVVVSRGVAFADVLDPRSGVSTTFGLDRSDYAGAITLADGRVLLVGAASAILDPVLESLEPSGPLHLSLPHPVLELLPDGRVLAMGSDYISAATSEVWDPATGEWTEVARPSRSPFPGESVSLSNGKVVSFASTDVELFDPATNTWSVVASLPSDRAQGAAARLEDGTILLTGGWILGAQGEQATDEVFSW